MKIRLNRWNLLFFYFIFQFALLGILPKGFLSTLVNYSDELIGVLLLVEVVIKKKYKNLDKDERKMLSALIIFEIIGIIAGLLYQFQSIPMMLVDAFQCSKFLIYYFCVRCLTHGKFTDKFLYRYFNRLCKFLAVVLFVLTIHDLVMPPFFPKSDFRYFTNSMMLFYGHPTTLARICSAIIFILAFNCKFEKKNINYILMLVFVMFFTFRSKAIASAAIILLIYCFVIKGKMRSKLWISLGSIAGALIIGYSQFESYYSHTEYARAIITSDSIKIAREYFPFGSGFGTFASNVAATNYSNLYIQLGYLNHYELGKNSTFLSDTCWPIVIAQTGILGSICFVFIIGIIIKRIFSYIKNDKYSFWAMSSMIVYDLISSTAEPAFFHPTSMIAYIILALIISTTLYPQKNYSDTEEGQV